MKELTIDISVLKKINKTYQKSGGVGKLVIGIVALRPNGKYYIKHNNKLYIPTPKSLSCKNKQTLFIFDKKGNIICYDKKIETVGNAGFPFMSLAPGYLVIGRIIKHEVNSEFDVKMIRLEKDEEERNYFKENKLQLIKAYNGLNTPID